MAIIKGFKAIRPTRDKAYLVASRSYLTYSEETLREKLLNNPYTFLHIINPEYSLNTPLLEGTKKFEKVRDKYTEFLMEGTLVADKKECLYIYQQVKPNYRNISLCINVELPVDISLLHEPQLVLIRCAYLIC